MQKERGFRIVAIVAICVAVVALSIGYAALSQTLSVNGAATVKGNTWNVQFTNLTVPTKENGGLVGSASEVSSNLAGTNFTFAANLSLPGDSITYLWSVSNTGTITAKLSDTPIIAGLEAAQAKNVIYTLTYADGTAITKDDELAAGQTENLKLVATFDASATTVPSTDTELTLSTTLNYVQK